MSLPNNTKMNTMTIREKLGNLDSFDCGNRQTDWLEMEWHETNKRILHKKSMAGIAVMFRFLNEDPAFTRGDIIHLGEKTVIAIEILPCDAIVLLPKNKYELAAICYETGNKHLPLFYDNEELLVPFDPPFFRQMSSLGYAVKKENRKLLQPLRTTVKPHGNAGETIFSKVLKMGARYE